MKQIVAHKKIHPVMGVLIILLLLGFLIGLNYVLGFLVPLVGRTVSEIFFWLIGAVIAWWFLRTYVVKYSYEMTEDVLRLNRMYGKRERFIADIYLNRLVYVGTLEEAKKKNPNAKVVRALQATCKIPPTAIAYKTSSETTIALIQADEELKAKLLQRMQKKS
ncbi:MAG: hypothetical protein IJA26_08515 [Clostridia bacterium]|nr:hypothetical protein [Clostridia bacterium]